MEPEKVSVELNVEGENNKVVGGNIIHGDAHFHIHGDTTSSKKDGKAEKVTSARSLDPEVEVMLTKLNLMSLKTIFIEEELTMSDLAKITDDQLSKIGVRKIKHRLAIIDEVKARTCALTGIITLSATGAAAKRWPSFLGRYLATGEEHQGAPVYRKSDGGYLSRYRNGTWHAGWGIGGHGGGYKGVDTTADCPARVRQWQYYHSYDGGSSQSGDITAKCSVHTYL